MHAAREAIVAHITDANLAFNRVAPYAGELARAIRNPANLTSDLPDKNMPAALVLYTKGKVDPSEGKHPFDVLIITSSEALKRQENAGDALALAETLATWLMDNTSFQGDSFDYTVNMEAGIEAEQLLLSNKYAVVRLGLTLDVIKV